MLLFIEQATISVSLLSGRLLHVLKSSVVREFSNSLQSATAAVLLANTSQMVALKIDRSHEKEQRSQSRPAVPTRQYSDLQPLV
jgi:hypothetical protein